MRCYRRDHRVSQMIIEPVKVDSSEGGQIGGASKIRGVVAAKPLSAGTSMTTGARNLAGSNYADTTDEDYRGSCVRCPTLKLARRLPLQRHFSATRAGFLSSAEPFTGRKFDKQKKGLPSHAGDSVLTRDLRP